MLQRAIDDKRAELAPGGGASPRDGKTESKRAELAPGGGASLRDGQVQGERAELAPGGAASPREGRADSKPAVLSLPRRRLCRPSCGARPSLPTPVILLQPADRLQNRLCSRSAEAPRSAGLTRSLPLRRSTLAAAFLTSRPYFLFFPPAPN